jgi:hypothetical protein
MYFLPPGRDAGDEKEPMNKKGSKRLPETTNGRD